jgi:single-strand DNA-binding protein
MAGSLNKVMLIGNLGKDPEVRTFEGGGKIVRFTLATSETYNNRQGEKVTHTEWHNITVGRKGLADVCEQYLKKGHKIFAEGRLRTRSWEDQNGVTKYSTEIQLDNMTMLTSREDAARMNQGGSGSQPMNAPANTSVQEPQNESFAITNDDVDDLPF